MDFAMTARTEDNSATMPLAQQAEAVHLLWRWAKPCVWTARMLTALLEGVEGGVWFRLSHGPTASSPSRGCSVWQPPMPRPVNPHEGKTINRRAGCGRTACPVRREERPKPIGRSYPYVRLQVCLVGEVRVLFR
jgi:hypothetical protein